MCSNKSVFLLLIIVSAVVSQLDQFRYDHVQLAGACPRITFIINLDIPRILGWYYRPHTNLIYPACFDNDGQTMFAVPINATAFDLAFCCRSAANPQIATCGPDVGSGLLTTTSRQGEFMYQTGNKVYPTYVLDTDYDTFAVFYGCIAGSNNERDQTIFIYSRNYVLSPIAMSRTRHFMADSHVHWADVRDVTQGFWVPYVPHQRPCN